VVGGCGSARRRGLCLYCCCARRWMPQGRQTQTFACAVPLTRSTPGQGRGALLRVRLLTSCIGSPQRGQARGWAGADTRRGYRVGVPAPASASSPQAAIAQLAEGRVDSFSKAHESSTSEAGSEVSPASRPHEAKAPRFSSLILAAPGASVTAWAGGGSSARSRGRLRPESVAAPFEALVRSVLGKLAGRRRPGRLQPPADRTRLTLETCQGSVRRNVR
jgi:hypothetical protein